MRILVHEHLTATAPPGTPSHLLRQGEAMIRALLADLGCVAGVTVVRLPPARDGRADVMTRFEHALDTCDAVWPIAPESSGCLEALSRRVLARGRVLLNSRPEAVRVAGSKWLTWRALDAAGVPAVPTYRHLADAARAGAPVVAKPDDGAGCEHTYLLSGGDTPTGLPANAVFQPWIAGTPRSFSMLCSDRGAELLCRNTQRISVRDDRLCFEGVDIAIDAGGVRGDEGLCARGSDVGIASTDHQHGIAALPGRVHAALPGLRGFVGVDYIDSANGPVVVEVNPRLTTAYVGLSARLHRNLAADLLQALTGVPAGAMP